MEYIICVMESVYEGGGDMMHCSDTAGFQEGGSTFQEGGGGKTRDHTVQRWIKEKRRD